MLAVELVNRLVVEHAFGRPAPRSDPFTAVEPLLGVDPTWPPLEERDVSGLVALARRLRDVLVHLDHGDLDTAATELNALLAAHPAPPHLAKHDGRWRLHHHPADAALVPMATAICADAVARIIGSGDSGRLGTCDADACDRVFLDGSKNASRRFCSTTCQNRVKAAAFRRRHATTDP